MGDEFGEHVHRADKVADLCTKSLAVCRMTLSIGVSGRRSS